MQCAGMLGFVCLVAALGLSLAATRLTIRVSDGQEKMNEDILVTLNSTVSIICDDDASQATGDFFFNEIITTLPKTDGAWTISSMSVEHQGAYKCCVASQCEDVAVISELTSIAHSGMAKVYFAMRP